MPLFTIEQNRIANDVSASALTFRLHTAVPTNNAPTNGRVTGGGGLFATGVTIAASNLTVAANGDFQVNVDIDFGTATSAAGTVAWVSAYRGSAPVGYVTIPSTTIANADTFKINANTLHFNGSST